MLVILDRDGVINYDSSNYIKSPVEWEAIPGSLEAIVQLKRANHKVVIASNQSGVGRGYFSLDTLAAIHQKMHNELAAAGGHLDAVFFCPHSPEEDCECRKPRPGLFFQIAQMFPTNARRTIIIGDSLRDIEFARASKCAGCLVKTGNGAGTLLKHPELIRNIPVFEDLAEAVRVLFGDGEG